VLDSSDAGFIYCDTGKIGGGRRGKFLRRTDAPIVSDALQSVGEIRIPQPNAANEREDDEREDDGRAFGSLELHAVG